MNFLPGNGHIAVGSSTDLEIQIFFYSSTDRDDVGCVCGRCYSDLETYIPIWLKLRCMDIFVVAIFESTYWLSHINNFWLFHMLRTWKNSWYKHWKSPLVEMFEDRFSYESRNSHFLKCWKSTLIEMFEDRSSYESRNSHYWRWKPRLVELSEDRF